MLTVYGLKNCDTCRKALKTLDADAIAYTFVDFNKDTIAGDTLASLIEKADLAVFINRRSTTWRTLDDATKTALQKGELDAFMANLSVIKRPVFQQGDTILNGFTPAVYHQIKV